jgi:hypothetical protein
MIEISESEKKRLFAEMDAIIAANAVEAEVTEKLRVEHHIVMEDENEPIECCQQQRKYFEGARQRAIQTLPPFHTFGNRKDYETHVQMRMCLETGMSFCNTIIPGDRPGTVDQCAERMVAAEGDNSKKDRLIDDLKDEIHDLHLQLNRAKGATK